jgi:hypothetical protein
MSSHVFIARGLMHAFPFLGGNFVLFILYSTDLVCFHVSFSFSELISWQMSVPWSTCSVCDHSHQIWRNKNGNADQNWLRVGSDGLLL